MPIDPADPSSAAFLGLRLRALEQVVNAQGRDLLNAFQIRTPNVCVSVLRFIGLRQPTTVTEIVDSLGVSRQLVLQRLALLEDQGLIESATDEGDRRSRLIKLTRPGAKEDRMLCDLLTKIDTAFEELHDELGVNLSVLLDTAARQLQRRGLVERVLEPEAQPAGKRGRAARHK